jgi:uncharacterized protein (TIGR00369 family)
MAPDPGTTKASTEAAVAGDWPALTELLQRIPLHAMMGLTIVDGGPPMVMTMELTDAVRGPIEGTVHGGMLATLADVASALSLRESLEPTEIPVTTDIHLRYYRQPQGGPLTAVAHVVHRGRRLLGTECSITDSEQRVLARSTATYMVVTAPEARGL